MALKEIMCEICGTQARRYLRKSPSTCKVGHSDSERACEQCWEAHLSTEVEEKAPSKVECMFCNSVLPKSEIKYLARSGTFVR